MKRLRCADEPRHDVVQPNHLLRLPMELQIAVMEFLTLRDLHAYCDWLFTVYRTRSLHVEAWKPLQNQLLHGAAHWFRAHNTQHWGGWARAQMRAAEMELSAYTRSEGNRAYTLAQMERAKRILDNPHYEVIHFVVTPLCQCCEQRDGHDVARGVRRALWLCRSCGDAMHYRRYSKKLDDACEPYSWVTTQLVRNLLHLPRSVNVAELARQQEWRCYSGNYGRGTKTEYYLLYDVMRAQK